MASTEPPPPPRGDPPGRKSNPFDVLKLCEKDITPDGVKRAYRNLMLNECHPDKHPGKEELAVKVNLAYDQLKNKEEDELKAKWKECQGAAGFLQQLPDGTTLSNVIEDKTLSEHFRRLKKALEEVAKETKFRDNFREYYKQVLDNVECQPEVKGGSSCAVCGEEVIHEEDHEKVVFQAYYKFVLGNEETKEERKGLVEYVEETFKEEQLMGNWVMPEDDGYWGGVLTYLLSSNDDVGVEELCHNASTCREETPVYIGDVDETDMILPAYLHVFRGFTEWLPLSIEVASYSPRTSLSLLCAYKAINPSAVGENDPFLPLGEAIVRFGRDLGYAHFCFLLGSCDLSEVGNRILKLSNSLGSQQLAVFYFAKTRKRENLVALGKGIMEENKEDIEKACDKSLALFYLCVWEADLVELVMDVLGQLLPAQWHWKFVVQALMVDFPDLIFQSTAAVAAFTLLQIKKRMMEESQQFGNPWRTLMKLMGTLGSSKLLSEGACGALHILQEDQQRYPQLLKLILDDIKNLMDMKLSEGDVGFFLGLARFPGIETVLEETLIKKRFLGEGQVTPTPGQDYYVCLFVLRAIYNFKHRRYSQMADDLVAAVHHTVSSTVYDEIAAFIVSNPLIHEKLIKMSARQFEQLQAFVDDYSGDPLEKSNFLQVLQNTSASIQPYLSAVITSSECAKGQLNVNTLEQNILDRNPNDFLETGLAYVDLLAVCQGSFYQEICCVTMAAHFFLKAMLATPDEDIIQKFVYRGLVLESGKHLKPYATSIWLIPVPTALHPLRAMLSFQFHANQHFSQVLRKNQQHVGITNYIDEGDAPEHTGQWQLLLNLRTVCPLVSPEIWTIAEGRIVMVDMFKLWISGIKEKIKLDLYSDNTPEFMYHQLLFVGVWDEYLSPEDTGYDDGFMQDLMQMVASKLANLNCDAEKDSDEEKQRKVKEVQDIEKEVEELERQRKEMSLVERLGFVTSRENAMIALANHYGYDINDVEAMMGWSVIRRTPEGWLDMENRTLNFEGAPQTFSKFVGFEMNLASKTFQLLLVPAVKGDPNRPELFSSVDLMEIFGLKLCAAYLSFEEERFPPNVPEYIKLVIPSHPFFQVAYIGATPSGASKESICGTHLLTTLYHLDLLAKIFTTGQEVSANFPFQLRSTKNILEKLDENLQSLLKQIGERKKAVHLRVLELIHRFWFAITEIEEEVVLPTPENPINTLTAKFGNANLALNTMSMIRDKDGQLQDDASQFDEQSPEAKFVRGFNENMGLIEKEFPIIMRLKELAKMMSCVNMIHSNKENWGKLVPAVKQITEFQVPPMRPYSKCGQVGAKCKCCNWVPAVFGKSEVTQEQKLEYIFDKYGTNAGKSMVEGAEEVQRLLFHPPGQQQQTEGDDDDATNKSGSASANGTDKEKTKKASEPKFNTELYDRIEQYRVYGGVEVFPQSKSVTNMPPAENQSKIDWGLVLDVGLFAASFLPLGRVAGRVFKRIKPLIQRMGYSIGKFFRGPAKLPDKPERWKHIFKNKDGHFVENTKANRDFITEVANEGKFWGKDKWGNIWFDKKLEDGQQGWAIVRGNRITDGGLNKIPREWHPETGFSAPTKPKPK